MINDSHCICWHAFFNDLCCPKYNFLCQKWFCFPSVVSHLKCIHGHSLDHTKNIYSGANIGTKHHRQFCTKVMASTRKTWSYLDVVMARGIAYWLQNTWIPSTQEWLQLQKVFKCWLQTRYKICKWKLPFWNLIFWGCSTKYRLWYWASYKIALIRRQRL